MQKRPEHQGDCTGPAHDLPRGHIIQTRLTRNPGDPGAGFNRGSWEEARIDH